MRSLRSRLVTLSVLAAVGARAAAPVGITIAQPPATPTSVPFETPVIDPDPLPLPLNLPWLAQRDDRAQPPPITPGARGYVAALLASGRRACAPATHVLLARPQGSVANIAVAVLAREGDDPLLTLDLYIDEYVEVGGSESTSAIACWPVTERLIGVRTIRVVDRPPGTASRALSARDGRPSR